jgi:hypothetical protein
MMFSSMSDFAVMSAPLLAPPSTTTTASHIPLIMRLRRGNTYENARMPHGCSEMIPPDSEIRCMSAPFSGGYTTSTPVPSTATVRPSAGITRCPTRTSSSFELAAKRLSADTMSIKAAGSSVDKGESLKDTALTLGAYDPDVIVLRHPQIGAPELVAFGPKGIEIHVDKS